MDNSIIMMYILRLLLFFCEDVAQQPENSAKLYIYIYIYIYIYTYEHLYLSL